MPSTPSIRPFCLGGATLFFAPAIIFLRSGLHISSRRLADVFGISTANVDTIRFRGVSPAGDPGIESLLDPAEATAAPAFYTLYGLRSVLRNRPLPKESVSLDTLEHDVGETFTHYARAYDYVGGAQALLQPSEKAGYPRRLGSLRVIARV
jgi:hypothetical protein